MITVDIEETNQLNLQKYNEYGFSDEYSPFKQIPQHTNDIYCFHRVKSISEFDDIKDHYLKKVFSHDELYCSLVDNEDTFQLSRKSFITEKQFSEFVDIKIYNKKGHLLLNFERAEIFKYFHFYSRNFAHNLDHVYVKIAESDSGNIIFSNFMKIHK
jgi:exoribonuclease R